MSRLHPSLMVLDKGLNLQAPKILAPEGSVLDSLNYEQVDFQGQKRIEGYARYDGSCLPALDDFIVLSSEQYTTVGDLPDIAFNDSNVPFAVILGGIGTEDDFALAVINEVAIPEGYVLGVDYVEDAEEHYNLLLEYTAILRERVEDLPGAVIGLHWFRDRLYAVADIKILAIDTTGFEVPPDILANDLLESGSDTFTALDVVYLDNFVYVLVDSELTITSFTVVRTEEEFTVDSMIAGYKASFYESRTEQQVIDEDGPSGPYDFGWRFKHLGWAVPFEDGNSPFGELTSLNQNRQGVGVQGPTSIAGNNGKPLLLTQKVNITNLPTQVNGWKTSTSPNVYSLEAGALDDIDGVTIYADAFFSWDGVSGEVNAPGITGEGLIEYPANNSVVVDV